jgi:hypothetical protein
VLRPSTPQLSDTVRTRSVRSHTPPRYEFRGDYPLDKETTGWNDGWGLWSLWDIVNHFDGFLFFYLLSQLASHECVCMQAKVRGNGGQRLQEDGPFLKEVLLTLERFRSLSAAESLPELADVLTAAAHQLSRPLVDISTVFTCLNNLKLSVITSLQKRKFLRIAEDRSEFMDQEALFGERVNSEFPSAVNDIREAGNCFAVECTTASVFHLMRVAEFGLRSLARDRDISFKDKPLDEKQWGEILSALESSVGELRQAGRKNWTSPALRDEQIRFYNEVVQELRSFNDAWRRHISHADPLAFYDRDQAASVMKHVRTFMQKLSTRVSETSITKKFWASV